MFGISVAGSMEKSGRKEIECTVPLADDVKAMLEALPARTQDGNKSFFTLSLPAS